MERGQASIEWLGVVALVGVVVALAAAAGILRGDAVASAVVGGMHRALCVVRGGVCDLDRRPCVVEAGATVDDVHVNLAFVRLGRTELILREHRSDGSVLVTYLHDTSSGWDVGVGADLWASAAGHELVAGSAARAALLTSLGGGETWAFDDALDADVAMAQLGEGRRPTVGRRAARFAGTGLGLSADVGGKAAGLHARLGLDGRMVEGTFVDEQTGDRTHVLQRVRAVDGSAGRRGAEAGAVVGDDERMALVTAADGTPLELTVVRTGELGGTVDVPDIAKPVAEAVLGAGRARHRRWVVEQRLDLTEPESLAAVDGLLAAFDDPLPSRLTADAALRSRLSEAAVTEVRTYGVERDAGGIVGHAGAGAKIGGGLTDATDRARLLSARVLGPDGRWTANPACRVE